MRACGSRYSSPPMYQATCMSTALLPLRVILIDSTFPPSAITASSSLKGTRDSCCLAPKKIFTLYGVLASAERSGWTFSKSTSTYWVDIATSVAHRQIAVAIKRDSPDHGNRCHAEHGISDPHIFSSFRGGN